MGASIYNFVSKQIPVPIPQCFFWCDPDRSCTRGAGDKVSQWNDLSEGGFTLTQDNDDNRPVWVSSVLDGYPIVRFQGNQWLTDNSVSSMFAGNDQPFSFFVIVNKIDLEKPTGVWSVASSKKIQFQMMQLPYIYNPPPDQLWLELRRYSTNSEQKSTPLTYESVFRYFVGVFNGTNITVRENGVVKLNNQTHNTAPLDSLDIFEIGVAHYGESYGRYYHAYMDLAGIGFFQKVLNSSEIDILENYIKARYPSLS